MTHDAVKRFIVGGIYRSNSGDGKPEEFQVTQRTPKFITITGNTVCGTERLRVKVVCGVETATYQMTSWVKFNLKANESKAERNQEEEQTMLKLRNTERLSGEKYTEARAANKALLEQCESYDELYSAFMTATKATMKEAAVSCGMSPLYRVDVYKKEGAARYCALEILRVRKIRDFRALGQTERLEAMRRADDCDRHAYVNSLTNDELSAYVAELYAGQEAKVAHTCKYGLGLIALMNVWLNEHLIDSTAETAAVTTSEPSTETTKSVEAKAEPATDVEIAEPQTVEEKEAVLEKSPVDEAVSKVSSERTTESIAAVLEGCTKAQLHEVFLAITGNKEEKGAESWKKAELVKYYAARIRAYYALEEFKAMDAENRGEYIKSLAYRRDNLRLEVLFRACSLYEAIKINAVIGVSFQAFQSLRKEKHNNLLYRLLWSMYYKTSWSTMLKDSNLKVEQTAQPEVSEPLQSTVNEWTVEDSPERHEDTYSPDDKEAERNSVEPVKDNHAVQPAETREARVELISEAPQETIQGKKEIVRFEVVRIYTCTMQVNNEVKTGRFEVIRRTAGMPFITIRDLVYDANDIAEWHENIVKLMPRVHEGVERVRLFEGCYVYANNLDMTDEIGRKRERVKNLRLSLHELWQRRHAIRKAAEYG